MGSTASSLTLNHSVFRQQSPAEAFTKPSIFHIHFLTKCLQLLSLSILNCLGLLLLSFSFFSLLKRPVWCRFVHWSHRTSWLFEVLLLLRGRCWSTRPGDLSQQSLRKAYQWESDGRIFLVKDQVQWEVQTDWFAIIISIIIIITNLNLDTGSMRSPDHWCAISKWRLVDSDAPSKAPASTKNPEKKKHQKPPEKILKKIFDLATKASAWEQFL